MASVLAGIQDTVIKYANIIAQVIDVDVEIVDENLYRLAGTGAYRDQVNADMSTEGEVYTAVLRTGQPQFIAEPGKHDLCRRCHKRDHCLEKLELSTPITLDTAIIGVIGLICFTEDQRDRMLKNFEAYRAFLGQIAEFISIKAYEQQETERIATMMKLLHQVIENMGRGVLILDKDNTIVHLNTYARRELALGQAWQKEVAIEGTGQSLIGLEEFKVHIDGKGFSLLGEMFPVEPPVAHYAKVLVFNESKKIRSGIYGLTSVNEDIRLADILGNSPPMRQLKKKIQKIADSNSTVLITGESGTGKELFARAIHAESGRRRRPFVAVNCAALPDTLLESELFGYVRGAFTGADPRGKVGKFELAHKGIIFLDEIGDLPLYLQAKLLRVLQERKITRIGSNQQVEVDVRILAATNQNLATMIREGKFREDLYYRLNVIPLEIPPLRDRREDIGEIVGHLIKKYGRLFAKDIAGIDPATLDVLGRYPWPGNVRELENTVEFMVNMLDDEPVITNEVLPSNLRDGSPPTGPAADDSIRPLAEVEREMIERALAKFGPTTRGKQQAAKQLGIGVATLYRKLGQRPPEPAERH